MRRHMYPLEPGVQAGRGKVLFQDTAGIGWDGAVRLGCLLHWLFGGLLSGGVIVGAAGGVRERIGVA